MAANTLACHLSLFILFFGNQGEMPATNVTLVPISVALGSFFSQI